MSPQPKNSGMLIAIRYKKPLQNVLDLCEGCGSPFSLSHPVSCRKSGLVIQHHNEVRDVIRDLASLVWGQIKCEPVVKKADNKYGTQALVADLAVRGIWLPQAKALFDIRVSDTDAQSYRNHSPREVLQSAEREKKASTQLLVRSDVHFLHHYAVQLTECLVMRQKFFKRIGDNLALKWDISYREVMEWLELG